MAVGVLMAWDYDTRMLLEQDITQSSQGCRNIRKGQRLLFSISKCQLNIRKGGRGHIPGAASLAKMVSMLTLVETERTGLVKKGVGRR